MPYAKNADLPDAVKELPTHAKTIWRKAFNAAAEEYEDEQVAFKVAWSAVKRSYEKSDGEWVKKEGHAAGSFSGSVSIFKITDDDSEIISLFGAKATGELLAFKGTLARAETNKNKDDINTDGITELCTTLPLMPLDIEHRDRELCGVFLKAEPVDEGTAVGVQGVVYARRFPEIAQGMEDGTQKLSVEAWAEEAECSECGEVFTKGKTYCEHLKTRYRGGTARRILRGLSAFGGAATTKPAGTNCDIDAESLALVASEEDGIEDEVDEPKEDATKIVSEVIMAQMSYEQMRDTMTRKMREQMKTMMGDNGGWGYVAETYPDHMIWQQENYDTGETKAFKVPYAFDVNGECSFGEMSEMEQIWKPIEGMEHPDLTIKSLNTKITELEVKVQTVEAANAESISALEVSKTEVASLQSECDGHKATNQELTAKVTTLETDLGNAKNDATNARQELTANIRLSEITTLLGSEQPTITREELQKMSNEAYQAYVAGIGDARKNKRPGSLKGILGGDAGSTGAGELPASFKGLLSGNS